MLKHPIILYPPPYWIEGISARWLWSCWDTVIYNIIFTSVFPCLHWLDEFSPAMFPHLLYFFVIVFMKFSPFPFTWISKQFLTHPLLLSNNKNSVSILMQLLLFCTTSGFSYPCSSEPHYSWTPTIPAAQDHLISLQFSAHPLCLVPTFHFHVGV